MVYFPGWNFAQTYGKNTPRQRPHNAGSTARYPTQPGKPTKLSHPLQHQPAEGVRQVAAGARQTDVARAQGLSPALLGRWQRQALVQAVPGSAEREEIKRLRAELRRVEQERDRLKKVVTRCLL